MENNEHLIPIPGRLHSVATEGHVSGADEIYDDTQQKNQATINSELIEAVGTGGSVDTRITNAVNVEKTRAEGKENTLATNLSNEVTRATDAEDALDSKITAEQTRATSVENALDERVDTLEEAVGTGGSVDSRITSAVTTETSRAQAAEADRYTKSETYTKEEVNNLITTPNQEYVSVTATSETTSVTDILPATGASNTIYRVGNWDGTQYNDSVFSEYVWNGSTYIKLSTKSQVGEVYDISANHADIKYADLTDALGVNGANIPQSLQKGGMSIKFVQSSDNKYVQYRLMSDTFNTTESNWQGIDNMPTAESDNLVKSGGVYTKIKALEDAGYVFAGIATPTTNPGTPNSPVFYLASESGTYSNFGGITLTDEVAILSNTNDSWVKSNTGIATSTKVSELYTNIKESWIIDTDEKDNAKFVSTEINGMVKIEYSSDVCYYVSVVINGLTHRVDKDDSGVIYYKPNGTITQVRFYSRENQGGKTSEIVISSGKIIEQEYDTEGTKEENARILFSHVSIDDLVVEDGKYIDYESGNVGTSSNYKLYIGTNVADYIKATIYDDYNTEAAIAFYSTETPDPKGYLKEASVQSLVGLKSYEAVVPYNAKIFVISDKLHVPIFDGIKVKFDSEILSDSVSPVKGGAIYKALHPTAEINYDIESIANSKLVDADGYGGYYIDTDTMKAVKYSDFYLISAPILVKAGETLVAYIYPHGTAAMAKVSGNITTVEAGQQFEEVAFSPKTGNFKEFTYTPESDEYIVLCYDRRQESEYYIKKYVSSSFATKVEIQSLSKEIDNIKNSGFITEAELNSKIEPIVKEIDEHSIITLNSFSTVGNRIIQAARRSVYENKFISSGNNITLSVMTDLHGDAKNLARFIEFNNKYKSYLDDMIQMGDIITDNWTSSFDFYKNTIGAENILCVIGNHDTLDRSITPVVWTQFAGKPAYDRYFLPFKNNWIKNVVQPTNAETEGKCYYYKDYSRTHTFDNEYTKYKSNGVRLIVLDFMSYSEDQLTWFNQTLEDASSKKMSVVCVQHGPLGTITPVGSFNSLDSSPYTSAYRSSPTPYLNAVDSFIDNGGEFICWISGDAHYDFCGYNVGHPNQFNMTFENAGCNQQYNDSDRVLGTKSQDSFNIVSFDTYSKLIKVVRVGNDCDRYMRSKKSFCLNYETKNLISNF